MLTSNALWPLLVWLSTSWLTTQAAEPDCTHVADFDNCPGNTLNFCPTGVACGCKDQRPFCKCPSYRSSWQNYWYLGPKCDQLWSTLDLILVTVLPAIALSATVAVAAQWVNYCKSKKSKGVKRHSAPSRDQRPQGQQNTAYVPNPADQARYVSQPVGRKDDGIAQNYKFPRVAVQNHPSEQAESPYFGGFSSNPHQSLRRAAPMGNNAFVGPPPHGGQRGYTDSEIPDADYEEENPFTATPMQQFQTSRSSLFPRPEYYERNPQAISYPNGAGNPYKIWHPQAKST